MDERIQRIIDRWSFSEEVFFAVLCEHNIEPNDKMKCPFRSGKGKIEYAPSLIAQLSDTQLELCLKAEAIRILLKHPYERQPVGCRRKAMSIGSNLVLADNYDFHEIGYKLPAEYNLPKNESYEYYAIHIENMLNDDDDDEDDDGNGDGGTGGNDLVSKGSSDSKPAQQSVGVASQSQDYYKLTLADGSPLLISKGSPQNTGGAAQQSAVSAAATQPNIGNASAKTTANAQEFNFSKGYNDLSQLWEEDAFMGCTIDSIIEDTDSWGNIPGDFVTKIIANVKVKVDYRKVLSGFRASVLSSKRRLTRMKPSRRSGFENMGSIRQFETKLLVAVDVSGSISDESIRRFYSAINRMFKYGIEHIDAVTFDYALGEVGSFKKKFKEVTVIGRGGTNYQPIFDYIVEHPIYDGLVIFTDGYAPKPTLSKKTRTKIAWVCNNMSNYERSQSWMREFGRCCAMEF